MLVHAVRDQEFRVLRPTIIVFGEPDFFFAQRLAVRRAGVLFVRRAVGDVAVHDDQRGPVRGVVERFERPRQHLQIVGVADPRDVPAICHEARGYVIAKRQRCVALNADVIVVVDPAQIVEPQMSRQ